MYQNHFSAFLVLFFFIMVQVIASDIQLCVPLFTKTINVINVFTPFSWRLSSVFFFFFFDQQIKFSVRKRMIKINHKRVY